MFLCRDCSAELVLGDNWTEAQKRNHTRLCRTCVSARGKAWYVANPERAAASQRAREAADPERAAERKRDWCARHPERLAVYSRREAEKRRMEYAQGISIPRSKQTPEHAAKRAASAAATLAATTRQCKNCGSDFTPTQSAQRICSPKCWNAIARRRREARDKHKIQVSPTAYRALVEKFGETCGICLTGPHLPGSGRGKGRLAVDHCHSTGRIRGLLCHKCNTAIGLLADDPARVAKAAEYLTMR